MDSRLGIGVLLISAIIAFPSAVFAQSSDDENNIVNWADPATINPNGLDILEFLDADLNGYAVEAATAYEDGDYERGSSLLFNVSTFRCRKPLCLV